LASVAKCRKQNPVPDAGVCLLLPALAPGVRYSRSQISSFPGSKALGWVRAVTGWLHLGLLGLWIKGSLRPSLFLLPSKTLFTLPNTVVLSSCFETE